MSTSRLRAAAAPAQGKLRPRLLMPRYWPTWAGIGLSCLLSLLPFARLLLLGRRIRALFRWLNVGCACTARRNIQHCLPELRAGKRECLLEQHFESLGIVLMEINGDLPRVVEPAWKA